MFHLSINIHCVISQIDLVIIHTNVCRRITYKICFWQIVHMHYIIAMYTSRYIYVEYRSCFFRKLDIIAVYLSQSRKPIINRFKRNRFFGTLLSESQDNFFSLKRETHYFKQILGVLYLPSLAHVAFPFFSSLSGELITFFHIAVKFI